MPKKKKKLEHEMFRKTAIDLTWERIKDRGLESKKRAFLDGDPESVTTQVFDDLKIAEKSGALELFKEIDTWLYAAFHQGEKMVDWLSAYIDQLLKEHFKAPGFINPETGETYDAELSEFIGGHAILMTYLYGWGENGQFTYVLSEPLARMLLHTKLNRLPSDQLKLPQTAIYISPPVGTWPDIVLSENSLAEAHKFWGIDDSVLTFSQLDGILITRVGESKEQRWSLGTMQNVIARTGKTISLVPLCEIRVGNPDISAGEAIENASISMRTDPSPEWMACFHQVLEYIIATVVYVTVIDSDAMLAKESPEYAQWLKEMERFPPGHKQRKRLQQQLDIADTTNRYYLGKTIKIDRHLLEPKQEGKGGTHASPRTHWRSGHFRTVWRGPKEAQSAANVWIKPTIVNATKGPIHTKQRVVK